MLQKIKLSISNIAWTAGEDETVYTWMQELGFTGLEIAPTRIFPEEPYGHIAEAKEWSRRLYEMYGFRISSMQSIWYGRKEKVFGTEAERSVLTDYTKRAINFAQAVDCGNLVFGSPVNRQVPEGMSAEDAVEKAVAFFKPLGAYARQCGTHLSMEANPPMYNTNFINDTPAALELIAAVDDAGFTLNLDVGTMVAGDERIQDVTQVSCSQKDNSDEYQIPTTAKTPIAGKSNPQVSFMSRLNHVHISEPGLKPIEHRALHGELLRYLQESGYERFVSIEMGKTDDVSLVRTAMEYVRLTLAEI